MPENIATTPGTQGTPASRREFTIFALVLAALIAVILVLTDGLVLFTRPLWVDEWLTVFPAMRPSPLAVLADLRAGVDGGAGLFHLATWAARLIAGTLTPTLLRALSLASVFTALCFTFLVLRRRFSVDASVAGALAVGSNVLVVAHAFEARFYGPWLLCCALFAWAVARHQERRSRGRTTLVAIASILLCTVHFYGVISLAVMCAGIVASYGRGWRDARRVVAAPLGAGALAVLAILPLAIGQRSAYSKRTWIPDFELRQLGGLLDYFWLAAIPIFGAIVLVAGIFLARRRPARFPVLEIARRATKDAGIVGLASLAVIPLALAIVSIAGQPSMLSRYAITTAIAWAPWIAWSMEVVGRPVAPAFRIVLAWFWFVSFTNVVAEKQTFASVVDRNRVTYATATQLNVPIVFTSIHVMYPVVARDLASRGASFLDLRDATIARLFPQNTELERRNRSSVIQRDLARVHAKRIGFPRLAAQATLDSTPRFVLLAPSADLPFGFPDIEAFGRAVFPNHAVARVHPDVIMLERRR